jgi:quercetin dioxygenase-like cupin family protein
VRRPAERQTLLTACSRRPASSDAPPSLPKGAKLAVLYGDPASAGLFVVRLKLPANYKVGAHSHPTDEAVTVISGSFLVGMGDKLDAAKAFGSFVAAPAKTNHFGVTRQATILEITGMGPLELTYVNPADDPRNK